MIEFIIKCFKNLDNLVKFIMKKGLIFCFLLCVFSLIILITYNLSLTIPFIYIIGLSLFKLSLIFGIEFIICGFAADKIKKQLI